MALLGLVRSYNPRKNQINSVENQLQFTKFTYKSAWHVQRCPLYDESVVMHLSTIWIPYMNWNSFKHPIFCHRHITPNQIRHAGCYHLKSDLRILKLVNRRWLSWSALERASITYRLTRIFHSHRCAADEYIAQKGVAGFRWFWTVQSVRRRSTTLY